MIKRLYTIEDFLEDCNILFRATGLPVDSIPGRAEAAIRLAYPKAFWDREMTAEQYLSAVDNVVSRIRYSLGNPGTFYPR